MKYSEHSDVIALLKKDQESETDLRDEIDEVLDFIYHPMGHWEPDILREFEGRPRYQFDMCKPVIAAIWAEMAANDYAADVQPAGNGADEDVANILSGMIRRMYNISSFPDQIAKRAGKRQIMTGFGACRLVSQYCSPNSFYQDLKVIPVSNPHRRVWFDCNAEMQTKEDAMHVHYLGNMQADAAAKMAGRVIESLSDGKNTSSYEYKPTDIVVIGEILYKKKTKKTIYLLRDKEGTIVDEDKLKELEIPDEMIEDSRETEMVRVYSRKYDAKDWIGEEKETVFSYLPIVPVYANYDITEDGKTRYNGCIRDLMDPQRVFDYAESRKVEESVLSPRRKLFMDDRLAEGYEDELSDINRDPRAIQLFNGDKAKDSVLPFFETSGPTPNPAISEISDNMIRNMQIGSGIPNPLEQMNATNKDSDFRFEQRTSMGQTGTFEYYSGYQIFLEHVLKVAIDAFPRVYDTQRKISIIDESGQSNEVVLNQTDGTGQILNNITVGEYNVSISLGENFETRSAKTNDAILEMGKIDPSVIQRNTDVIANNMKTPGMSAIADRERAFLMKQGVIPESQWTDEEKMQAMQAMQQPQQPDPMQIAAEAEAKKAQAEADKVQTQLLIEQAKLEQKQLEIQISERKQMNDSTIEALRFEMEQLRNEYQNLKDMASAAKSLAEAGNALDQRVINKTESEI